MAELTSFGVGAVSGETAAQRGWAPTAPGSEKIPDSRTDLPAHSWALTPYRLALLVTALALAWSYAPNLQDLSELWSNNENYTHGYLVIPIAVAIAWRRRPSVEDLPTQSTWISPAWGWLFLAVFLAMRAGFYESGKQWLENATFIPVVACLVFSLGGWPLLKRCWPAIAFLIFMLPLPQSVNTLIAMPLQRFATVCSCFLLQLTGLWVVADGNIINMTTSHGPEKLEVAAACNGLSMLMSLAAVVVATIVLIPLSNWKRVTLLASVLPIALFCNVLRIVATGWCYYLIGGEHGRKLSHDWAGFLMMPLAMILVFAELSLLAWLAAEEEEGGSEPVASPLLTMVSPRKS